MRLVRKSLPLLIGFVSMISSARALDKDKGKFTPPDLGSLTNKLSTAGVTIGAKLYQTEELGKAAFGKVSPYQHGVLPILVVIKNESKDAINLATWSVEYIDKERERIEPTPAADVPYLQAPKRPSMNPSPIPGIRLGKKNPLAASEIQTRSFEAKMLPPGETAHGFFYFRTGHRGGAMLYISGITVPATGKELFYFEIPFD